MKLYAPLSYWEATKEEHEAVCNGCGAKGGIDFPDTMYGLNVSEPCHIHDWMTAYGKTLGDFFFAGAIFILNLSLVIVNKSNKLTSVLRLMRASKYFSAVMVVGLEHYWKEKDKNDDMSISFSGTFSEIKVYNTK